MDFEAAAKANGGKPRHEWSWPESIPNDLKAALPAVIAQYEASMKPVRPDFLAAHLVKIGVVFPGNRTSEDWAVIIATFIEHLGDMAPDIIIEACRQHVRASRFFPTVAELYERCKDLRDAREYQLSRMRRLVALPTDEERAELERREAARKAAEHEAHLLANPDRRIFHDWFRKLDVKSWDWSPWLKDAVTQHGYDIVEAWHAEVAKEEPFDHLDTLRQKRAAYEAKLQETAQ